MDRHIRRMTQSEVDRFDTIMNRVNQLKKNSKITKDKEERGVMLKEAEALIERWESEFFPENVRCQYGAFTWDATKVDGGYEVQYYTASEF